MAWIMGVLGGQKRFSPPATSFSAQQHPMSSGVTVNDTAVEAYQELKLKKKFRFITFKMSDDSKQIILDKKVEKAEYDEFVASLPPTECRYGVYDFVYESLSSEGQRNKLLFYVWSPDSAKIKQKMLYAASKDALRKKLDGIYTEIQCTDLSEVSHETVLDKVTRMTS
ncbi:cofilin [Polyrhizophydium stewartii]|uniref:Cofilin n=1 Tax=Polyrhizophydium stewartii TaxID=2732419 RepID=A0ABR4N4I1_9FUNG